jgi:two-component system cell cycle response regulator DivK
MAGPPILIVEDDPRSLRLLRDLLQVRGYRTLETETAEEGLRLAREARPALILMDIRLPGMSGIEALACLRADPETSPIPVIAVTASSATQSRRRVMAAGFDGYQPKPIEVRVLLEAVRGILDRSDRPPRPP